MEDSKRLYFIPIIARALSSDDPKRAMEEAFNEINTLGNQPEYEEGFRQFQELIRFTMKPSGEESEDRIQLVRNAVYGLIYDLVSDTFDGDEKQKDTLISALRSVPEWNAEYERIKNEGQAFLAPETPIKVEVLRGNQVIGSSPITTDPSPISHIIPGRYKVQFSNGRVLWEGEVRREDVLWAYAFPEKDLRMAAETEPHQQDPTRTISLLDGELTIQIFAGLEKGEMRLKVE